MKKLVKCLIISLISLLVVSGCKAKNTINDKTIVVGASPSPHAEILNQVKADLEAEGYTLKIVEFTDYVLPNLATNTGELDANFFQHQPYLDSFNEMKGTDLISVGAIHYEPLGFYSLKHDAYDNLDNTKIAVPDDTTNCARALLLLDTLGIITVDKAKGFLATEDDITANPHNVDIVALEAASLPSQLPYMDYAVINGNYVLSSGLSISDTILAKEDAESVAATTYANILVVKKGNENAECIKALLEALTSQKVKDYITNNYNGAVLPTK
jgi:D-methionine transport system substrate-binding protein